MPSFCRTFLYRSGLTFLRYVRSLRRLATMISNPLRDAWSFSCVLKCSVSCVIRSLRTAICTSGEPVSDLWARLLAIICCLRSVASAISRVTAPCLLFISIYYTYRIPQDGMPEVGYWRPGARGRESRPVEQRTQLGMPPFVLSRIGGIGLVPP